MSHTDYCTCASIAFVHTLPISTVNSRKTPTKMPLNFPSIFLQTHTAICLYAFKQNHSISLHLVVSVVSVDSVNKAQCEYVTTIFHHRWVENSVLTVVIWLYNDTEYCWVSGIFIRLNDIYNKTTKHIKHIYKTRKQQIQRFSQNQRRFVRFLLFWRRSKKGFLSFWKRKVYLVQIGSAIYLVRRKKW